VPTVIDPGPNDMASSTPPPIALKSLSIRDFRGIESLDLDFRGIDGLPNQLVVLAGPNGCGKTAVLEAALMAVGGHKLAVGAQGKQAVRRGARFFEVRATILDATGKSVDVVVSSRNPPPEMKHDRPIWYFSSWRVPSLVGAVNVTVGKPGRRPAKTDPNRLLNVKQQLANAAAAESFGGDMHPAKHGYSRWIKGINSSWEKFYGDQSDAFGVGLTESDDSEEGAFEVFYKREGLPPLSVDDLSAGQLELFLFLAALVLNDDREGIVFIDEPELHLDPQWHAPVVRALMHLQPRAQFIVATHSPEIYDAAMSYERFFLVSADDPRASAWPGVQVGA
jgi:predicted ATPase